MKSHSSIQKHKKLFKCEIYAFSSSTKSNLNRHMEQVHEEIKPIRCDNCEYIGYDKAYMKKTY